jgi:EmrB/QacA subfamily drug resistance transporter
MSQRALLGAVFAGTFIALLDATIVTVALPDMQADLHAGITGAQWIVDAYAVCLAAFTLSGGALGDRYGRRRSFLLGLAAFLAGSLICALAGEIGVLITGRIVQGVAAALVVPGAMSIIGQAVPDPVRRARILGLWGMSAGLAVLSGPILGGVLVTAFGWPAIFLVNLPIGAVAIAAGLRAIPESADPEHAALDPAGQLLGITALGLLTYAVIETHRYGWGSATTAVLLGLAALAFAAFVTVEIRSARPMLPVKLFAGRGFVTVTAASAALGFGANGAFVLLSLYLQQAQGHSALRTGLLFIPMTFGVLPASAVAGRLTAAWGARPPMLIGYTVVGLSLLGLSTLDVDRGYLITGALFVANGLGQGLAIAPASAAILELAPRQRSGIASATLNTARQTGTAVGIATLGAILSAHLTGATRFLSAYTDGIRVGMTVAGAVVLAAAALLALPWSHRAAATQRHHRAAASR